MSKNKPWTKSGLQQVSQVEARSVADVAEVLPRIYWIMCDSLAADCLLVAC